MNGILEEFRREFSRIFKVKPAFSVLILGVAFYALFYPQPYLNEALRDVPIAVVDRDGTQSSRDFARRVDATPDVAVTEQLPDLASAEREVYARRVSGILVIPQYFERELLHGRSSPVALYADASYFLIYQRVAGAVTAVARTVGAGIESSRLIAIGVDPAIAVAASDPMPLTAVPLFNPAAGYATYVLPAAFVLILQQTLLMGRRAARHHAKQHRRGKQRPQRVVSNCDHFGQVACLSSPAGSDPARISHRAARSVRRAASWWRRSDPNFCRPIRAVSRGPWPRCSGRLSKADPRTAHSGSGRSSPVHGFGLLLAERGDTACHPTCVIFCAKHLRDRRLREVVPTRSAARLRQFRISHAHSAGYPL